MVFPDPLAPDADGLVFVGADFAPATIVEAYTRGLFPWRGGPAIPWYCPDPRAVIVPGRLRIARSLAKRARTSGFVAAFDRDFRGAMERCATTPRSPGEDHSTWITSDMIDAYGALHAAGIAHSLEVYDGDTPVGGLYGLTFGGLFHGESMYHHARDASKLALAALDRTLADRGFALIDCQVPTRHLVSLGAEVWPRERYLRTLAANGKLPHRHTSWREWPEIAWG